LDLGSGTLTFNGALAGGSGTFAKTGSGALVIARDNSAHTGATLVEGGILLLQEKLGGNVTVAGGARLAGAGAVLTGNLAVAPGAILQIGGQGGAVETLGVTGTLALNGATLLYDLVPSGTPPASATIDSLSAGALVLGGTNVFDFSNSIVQGDYVLVSANSITGFNAGDFVTKVNGADYSAGRMQVSYSTDSGTALKMNADLSASGILTWSGSTDNIWKSSGTAADWTGIDTKFVNGDVVIFDSVADADNSARRTIAIDGGGVTVAEMLVTGTGDYMFSGGAIHGTTDTAQTQFANPSGKLIKEGAGTLVLSNAANTFDGGVALNSGTLQGNTGSLGSGVVTTRAGASLVFSQTVSGTYAGVVAGESAVSVGNVYKKGFGELVVAGAIGAEIFEQLEGDVRGAAAISAGQYNLRGGTLHLGGGTMSLGRGMTVDAGGALSGAGRVRLGASGTFVHTGVIKIGKAAGLAGAGTLTIEGDYMGNGGVVELVTVLNAGGSETSTDLLHITGGMSGGALLHITNDGGLGNNTGTGVNEGIKVVAIDGAINGAFSLDPAQRVVVGAFDYGLVGGADGFYLQATAPSPEIPAAGALPAIAAIAGQASLDGIQQRLGEIRFLEGRDRGGWWLRNIYNESKLKGGLFGHTRFHTNVVQFGYDVTFAGESNWRAGAFYTNIDVAGKIGGGAAHVKDDAKGFGAYAMMQRGCFYAAAMIQGDDSEYRIFASGDELSVSGWNYGASVEAGYALKTKKTGVFEPQIMAGYQRLNTGTASDYYQRGYAFDDNKALFVRGGLRWHRLFDLDGGEWLEPWVRVGGSYEFLNRYDMRVLDAASVTHTFQNNMRGGQFIVDGGLVWGVTDQFSFNLLGSFNTGGRHEGITFTGGVRYVW
ncbi:MAG: autotransporter outer membrane beta-barrel domain-containing protein, partial [Opitutaceae bacterium]|nr:autotransporter outer membrane beta-barrel domain-containing protein [Opitutaceae bacterium]